MQQECVLITGGSKGIGLAAVRRFTALGFQVVTCGRSERHWCEAVRNNPDLGSVDFTACDITKRHQVAQWFDNINERYRFIKYAVNNASPSLTSVGNYQDISDDDLYSTLMSDFFSHSLCLKYELRLMSAGAAVVNISSINGLRPTPNAAMYSSAKHALEGLTRSVALQVITRGIRINSVAPGVTWTPRWQQREAESGPQLRGHVESMVPCGRFANVEEIVNAIQWLCSGDSSYVVGHTLVVDGGLSLT